MRVKLFFGILFLVSLLGVLFVALTPYLYRKATQNKYEKLMFYRPVWAFVFVALMILSAAGWQNIYADVTHYRGNDSASSFVRSQYPIYDNSYKVTKVTSGNRAQVKLNKGSVAIELIGVDMFSSTDKDQDACYKKQAARKLGQLLSDKKVELEGDDSVADTDKSDTLLRYLISDNKNINEQMIALGYAKTSEKASYKYHDEFSDAEKESSSSKLGLWSGSICRIITKNDAGTAPPVDNTSAINHYSNSRGQVRSSGSRGDIRNPKEDSGGKKDDDKGNDGNNGSNSSGCVIKLPILGCL